MKRISSPNSTLSLINPSQSEQHLSLQPVDEYSHLPSPSPHNNSSASTTTMPTSFEYCVHCNRHVQAFRTEIRSLTTKLKHEEYAREVLSQLNRRNDEELAKLLMEANRIKDETEVAYGDLMEDYEHLLDQLSKERKQHLQVLQDLKDTSEELASLKFKLNEVRDDNDKLINDLIQYKMSFASSTMYSDDLTIQNQYLQRQLDNAKEEIEWLTQQFHLAQEVLKDQTITRLSNSSDNNPQVNTPSKHSIADTLFGFLRPSSHTNVSTPRGSSHGFSTTSSNHSSRNSSVHGKEIFTETPSVIANNAIDANVGWKEYASPQDEGGQIEMRQIQPLEIELPDNFEDLLAHHKHAGNNSTMARLSDVVLL